MVRDVGIHTDSHDFEKPKRKTFPAAVNGDQCKSGQIGANNYLWVRLFGDHHENSVA